MKHLLFACFVLPAVLDLCGQHTVGVRIGDPIGINYKYYFNNPVALEVLLGISPVLQGATKVSEESRNFDFYRITADHVYALSMRFTYQLELPKIKKGRLDLYFGGGPRIDYVYQRETFYNFNTSGDVYEKKQSFPITGFEVVGGLEYRFEKAPITLYAETSWGLLFSKGPYYYLWGGIGARYILKRRSTRQGNLSE